MFFLLLTSLVPQTYSGSNEGKGGPKRQQLIADCREPKKDLMIKGVVQACNDNGYHITDEYAEQWLEEYPDKPNLAASGAKLDIEAREYSTIRKTGKLS